LTPRGSVRFVDGIRTTSPLWTLAHLGETEPPDRVELALESALRHRDVTEDGLWAQPALLPLLELRGRGTRPTESWLETRAVQLVLRPHGLAVVGRQVEVYEGAVFHGRVDFLLEGGVILEADGGEHATTAGSRRDNDRDLRLRGLGLTVARLDHRQVIGTPGNSARRLQKLVVSGFCPPFDGRQVRFERAS
jgi:very-short-patch-repair endonuclease